jgi:hypothetical protein
MPRHNDIQPQCLEKQEDDPQRPPTHPPPLYPTPSTRPTSPERVLYARKSFLLCLSQSQSQSNATKTAGATCSVNPAWPAQSTHPPTTGQTHSSLTSRFHPPRRRDQKVARQSKGPPESTAIQNGHAQSPEAPTALRLPINPSDVPRQIACREPASDRQPSQTEHPSGTTGSRLRLMCKWGTGGVGGQRSRGGRLTTPAPALSSLIALSR